MKKYIIAIIICLPLLFLSSCNNWLDHTPPGKEKLEDYFVNQEAAVSTVTGCYYPLAWEYNSTYVPEWFIGDVVSDDAQKGGQFVTDMSAVYDMENFKVNADNGFLLDYYRLQYQGVGRCNLAIQELQKMPLHLYDSERMKDRLIGEVKFLRAMYYFRLVRIFGGVPKVDFVVDSSNEWKQPRATVKAIYEFIIEDLKDAEKKLWKKSEYETSELGRATKGAAQAMLMKAYLYAHEHIENAYKEAEGWGEKFIEAADAGEYSLCPNYFDNFTLVGENGPESVFEIQYTHDPQSDYGQGAGFTRGTFTVILTRSRSQALLGSNTGWGFNRPSVDLYETFEEGDPRRDYTILDPYVLDPAIELNKEDVYLGNRFLNLKYAMLTDAADGGVYQLPHPTRAPINNKVIRFADVLLMYAEACVETGNIGAAQEALERVRGRARANSTVPNALPEVTSSSPDVLREAVRHERRVELAMEGHRWFDLNRWGIAYETMIAFKNRPGNEELRAEMNDFIEGVHELFPIPAEERRLGDLTQNNGY